MYVCIMVTCFKLLNSNAVFFGLKSWLYQMKVEDPPVQELQDLQVLRVDRRNQCLGGAF